MVNLKAKKLEEIFDRKSHWTQKQFVRMRKGSAGSRMSDFFLHGAPENSPVLAFCLVGAIVHIKGGREKSGSLINKIAARLRKRWPEKYRDSRHDRAVIINFNDDKDTKFSDIQEVIKGL